jgi:hypothetical protein
MFGILQGQTPAKQTATDTINTLSSRLLSATLLEDRRAAILGLRSFAKQFPASVASGSLRGLIGSLAKDAEDVDTVKVVLETLLMLFNPDENSVCIKQKALPLNSNQHTSVLIVNFSRKLQTILPFGWRMNLLRCANHLIITEEFLLK